MTLSNPNVELVNDTVYTKFGILFSRSQAIEQKQILTLIKDHNYVANLHKMPLYNPNVDPVNDNRLFHYILHSYVALEGKIKKFVERENLTFLASCILSEHIVLIFWGQSRRH